MTESTTSNRVPKRAANVGRDFYVEPGSQIAGVTRDTSVTQSSVRGLRHEQYGGRYNICAIALAGGGQGAGGGRKTAYGAAIGARRNLAAGSCLSPRFEPAENGGHHNSQPQPDEDDDCKSIGCIGHFSVSLRARRNRSLHMTQKSLCDFRHKSFISPSMDTEALPHKLCRHRAQRAIPLARGAPSSVPLAETS